MTETETPRPYSFDDETERYGLRPPGRPVQPLPVPTRAAEEYSRAVGVALLAAFASVVLTGVEPALEGHWEALASVTDAILSLVSEDRLRAVHARRHVLPWRLRIAVTWVVLNTTTSDPSEARTKNARLHMLLGQFDHETLLEWVLMLGLELIDADELAEAYERCGAKVSL